MHSEHITQRWQKKKKHTLLLRCLLLWPKWNDQAEVVELPQVCSYSTHCCYSGGSSAAIFTIPIIPELQTIQLFLSLRTMCPPALSPAKRRTAQRGPARPRIDFLINTPLWASAPCLVRDISQVGAFSPPHPPPPSSLILPFHQILWKEGVWHSGYQLPAQSRPPAQSPNLRHPDGFEY